MATATCPRVDIPGDVVGRPPYRAEGCLMHAMVLPGNAAEQQKLVDRLLNVPSQGALDYRVMTDAVLMTAIYVDTMRSLDPIDAQKGVVAEADLGFWIGVTGGPVNGPKRICWLPAFLFVDTGSAMASGREVYGYPKTLSGFTRSSAGLDDAGLSLQVLHYPHYAPGARPHEEPLVVIDHQLPASGSTKIDLGFWEQAGLATAWNLADPLVANRLGMTMPQLMLRQLRDPCTAGATQALDVLALDVVSDGIPIPVPLAGTISITFTPSDSHPIARTLGLQATVTPILAFRAQQDFTVGEATRIWGAP